MFSQAKPTWRSLNVASANPYRRDGGAKRQTGSYQQGRNGDLRSFRDVRWRQVCSSGKLRRVGDLWRASDQRIAKFDTAALAYDRHRPHYPAAIFDDFIVVDGLAPGDRVVEIGAGTGIATLPLADRGLRVTGIEPASAMAALLKAKVGGGVEVIERRFEDTALQGPVRLIAAFNSWHWVDPTLGVERLVDLLDSGGVVALVWTEVISWGQDPFADRLAALSGRPWVGRFPKIVNSKEAVAADKRFTALDQRRYRFERTLDAQSFVEVTKTYGDHLTEELLAQVAALINNEFDGLVTKVEEAAVHAYKRI
jgi:SAM-dependent methyltransferase